LTRKYSPEAGNRHHAQITFSPTSMSTITIVIFIGTLLAVLTRPRGLNEGIAALIGAILMLLVGAVSVLSALHILAINWNVFLFFLAMLTVTGPAEQAGIFAWLAI